MKLVITIPSDNEEKSLASVIDEIPQTIPGFDSIQILGINDGSTHHIAGGAIRARSDKIHSHIHNMGLAQTFRDGLKAALEIRSDIIVNTDADFPYDETEIPNLIAPIFEEKADIVLGDLHIDQRGYMLQGNNGGNKISPWVVRRATRLPIRGAWTGLRASSRKAALRMNLTRDSTDTQETLIQVASNNLSIEQVPVEFRRWERKGWLSSHTFRYARSPVCC